MTRTERLAQMDRRAKAQVEGKDQHLADIHQHGYRAGVS
jgi:hypothetical protein